MNTGYASLFSNKLTNRDTSLQMKASIALLTSPRFV